MILLFSLPSNRSPTNDWTSFRPNYMVPFNQKKKVLGQIIRVETSPYDRLSAYAGINLFLYST